MRQHEHDHKPPVRFFGKDSYWLGVELEVEAKDSERKSNGLSVLRHPKWCYAKHDGSLSSYGWELVTHPISRKLWLKQNPQRSPVCSFFRLVAELRSLDYTSHEGGRCGLHIHVSWSAFENVNIRRSIQNGSISRRQIRRQHVYWFMRLVNGKLFAKISQRQRESLGQWTQQRPISTQNFHMIGLTEGRYLATNVTEKTLEVRIFRGNMRENRIRKALEAVIAGVEFTRGVNLGNAKTLIKQNGNLDTAFVQYVADNQTVYPNLASYLTEIRVLTQSEDREAAVACVS